MISPLFRLPAAAMAGIMMLMVWASVTTPALAQGFPCRPLEILLAQAAGQFNEFPVYEAELANGDILIVLVAEDSSTFTFIRATASREVGCPVGDGFNWRTVGVIGTPS